MDSTQWECLEKIKEGSLVGSEESGEEEDECREDGFWGKLELELGGEVV